MLSRLAVWRKSCLSFQVHDTFQIDLTKVYYQIPLSESAMSLTITPTHRGPMECTRLGFGLVAAGASDITVMRLVVSGLSNIVFILIFVSVGLSLVIILDLLLMAIV